MSRISKTKLGKVVFSSIASTIVTIMAATLGILLIPLFVVLRLARFSKDMLGGRYYVLQKM